MGTKFLTLALAALLFASCSKNENEAQKSSPYISIDASVSSFSRALSTSFVKDDRISVYSWTGSNTEVQKPLVVNNSINTYDGTKWNSNPQMLWRDNTTSHYFIGIYPEKEVTDFSADSYATVTDLLVSTVLESGRTAKNGIVPLIFDHVMSKMVVNLTFRNQFGTTPDVESVTTDAQPGATVNYITKDVMPGGEKARQTLEPVTANSSYSIVVSPQMIYKIYISIEGIIYTYENATGFSLVQGKIQTVNLIVGRDRIELDSVTINDWTTGETIEGGEAQN